VKLPTLPLNPGLLRRYDKPGPRYTSYPTAPHFDAGHLPVWRGLELDGDDIIRADIISRIMCQGDVDITAIENRYGIDFWTYFPAAREQLATLEADGLVWICASRIVASSQDRYLLRVVAACFDRYLAAQSAQAPAAIRFSKVM
jgi:oxygen-independent coproporphyrinogen-3 oxidase